MVPCEPLVCLCQERTQRTIVVSNAMFVAILRIFVVVLGWLKCDAQG